MTLKFEGIKDEKKVLVTFLIVHYNELDDADIWFGYAGDGNQLDVVRFCDIDFEHLIEDFRSYLDKEKIKVNELLICHHSPDTEQELLYHFQALEHIIYK